MLRQWFLCPRRGPTTNRLERTRSFPVWKPPNLCPSLNAKRKWKSRFARILHQNNFLQNQRFLASRIRHCLQRTMWVSLLHSRPQSSRLGSYRFPRPSLDSCLWRRCCRRSSLRALVSRLLPLRLRILSRRFQAGHPSRAFRIRSRSQGYNWNSRFNLCVKNQ